MCKIHTNLCMFFFDKNTRRRNSRKPRVHVETAGVEAVISYRWGAGENSFTTRRKFEPGGTREKAGGNREIAGETREIIQGDSRRTRWYLVSADCFCISFCVGEFVVVIVVYHFWILWVHHMQKICTQWSCKAVNVIITLYASTISHNPIFTPLKYRIYFNWLILIE